MTFWTIKKRRDAKAEWARLNPVLGVAEKGYECLAVNADGTLEYAIDPDTGGLKKPFKMGDGRTRWNDLPYFDSPAGPEGLPEDVVVPPASETVKGRTRLATEGDTAGYAVATAAVTPESLGQATATVARPGLARYARPDEDGASGLLVTPARVKAACDAFIIAEAAGDAAGVVVIVPDPLAEDPAPPANGVVTPAGVWSAVTRSGLSPGILEWSESVDYQQRVMVSAGDKKLYKWLKAGPPNAVAGPRDPAAPPEFVPGPATPGEWGYAGTSLQANYIAAALNDSGVGILVISDSKATKRTVDSGKTWSNGGTIAGANTFYPHSVALNNNGRGIIVQESGAYGFGYTYDGGVNWGRSATLPSEYGGWRGAAVNNNDQALTVLGKTARPLTVATSSNFGQNWVVRPSVLDVSAIWYDCAMNDAGQAVAVAYASDAAAYSLDGGVTWHGSAMPVSSGFSRVSLNNSGHAVACGPTVSKAAAFSRDGGVTWQYASLPEAAVWQVRINDDDLCVATGYSPLAFAFSRDGGATWRPGALPTTVPYLAYCALNNAGAYLACYPSVMSAIYGRFVNPAGPDWSPYWEQYESTPVGGDVQTATNMLPRNCLPYDGGVYSRADYPALWRFIETFGQPVADSVWNKEGFSAGDGATTFRVPNRAFSGPVYHYLKAK